LAFSQQGQLSYPRVIPSIFNLPFFSKHKLLSNRGLTLIERY
jgi:hypothetical protein